MKHKSSFVISEFTNPSKGIVFRLSGWKEGVRIRKNFASRAEAEAERQILEIQVIQRETGIRTTATRLTEDQLKEAEAIYARLASMPKTLTFYLDYALINYREPVATKLLADAAEEYLSSKKHEHEQDLLSHAHLNRIERDLKRLKKGFPKETLGEITPVRLLTYLEAGRVGFKTFNNRRGIISTLFKFALQREWIDENPMDKIPARRIRRRRGNATTFSADQARELMAFVEKNYPAGIPFFSLCLFAGVRPCLRSGEILRLQPTSINFATKTIRIESMVSKVREPRNVTMQPNLIAWLTRYPLKDFPIIPKNLQHIREKVAREFPLSHDVMRHTFISMFVAKYRSIGEAALQAGNSEQIIRSNYLDLKTEAEATSFFNVVPKISTQSESIYVDMKGEAWTQPNQTSHP